MKTESEVATPSGAATESNAVAEPVTESTVVSEPATMTELTAVTGTSAVLSELSVVLDPLAEAETSSGKVSAMVTESTAASGSAAPTRLCAADEGATASAKGLSVMVEPSTAEMELRAAIYMLAGLTNEPAAATDEAEPSTKMELGAPTAFMMESTATTGASVAVTELDAKTVTVTMSRLQCVN